MKVFAIKWNPASAGANLCTGFMTALSNYPNFDHIEYFLSEMYTLSLALFE